MNFNMRINEKGRHMMQAFNHSMKTGGRHHQMMPRSFLLIGRACAEFYSLQAALPLPVERKGRWFLTWKRARVKHHSLTGCSCFFVVVMLVLCLTN